MSWWDIESRDPFAVCADADSLAERGTRDALDGKKSGFGSLTKQQLDDLAWTASWNASGAYPHPGTMPAWHGKVVIRPAPKILV